jgi:hypothetical protein
MELRLLETDYERQVFAERLAEARGKLGVRFREKPRSQLAKIQLAFGELYGLFERDTDPAERMIAGLSLHDLEMFPQTCPKPDLSHLPASSVVECSDLWSLKKGAGLMVWCGVVVPLAARHTQAVLVYLSAGPEGNAEFYEGTGFAKVGEPTSYPYLETLEGSQIVAQPFVLQGEAYNKLSRTLSRLSAGATSDFKRIRLKNFIGMRPTDETAPIAQPAVQPDRRSLAA